jgi:hypothetical protein
MSLNSLQDDMSRRAASMAAMAKHAKNPQEIQAIQKSLVAGVQNGTIQPYIGIPLIQDLTKKLTEVKAQMAQAVTGAGMPPPPQGGAPIAQQVMAQAAQADQSQGVEALASNLPQSYAGGGIIAFEDGGKVERYANTGFTGTAQVGQLGYDQLMKLFQTDPALAREAALRAGPTGARFLAALGTASNAANMALLPTAAGLPATMFATGVTGAMSPEQRRSMYSNPMVGAMSGDTSLGAAIQNAPNMEKPTMGYGEQMGNIFSTLGKTIVSAPGDKTNPKGYGLSRLFAPDDAPAVAPTATPAAMPYDPADATRRSMFQGQAQPSALGGAGSSGAGGGGGFKLPTLPTMKETPAPTLTDYDKIIGSMPEKTKAASEAAVKASQAELEGFDKPGFETREGRLGQREVGLEKDTAISRALGLISTGLGVAGSKERSLAGALGNEGRQGIADLIRGEAANRAAKEKLEDARDNLEQQKVAAKKGNYQAAQAAGKDAANDLRAGTQLTMTGAHYGNTEALNRYQTQQQGEFQKTSLGQSGILGLGNLDVQNRQLSQTGAFQTKQLEMMQKRYDAMDKASQARLMQVRAGAMGKFMENTAPQLNAQFVKDYGPNWRTATDPRSLEAQMKFKQAQNAYIMDALGQHDDRMSAKDSSEY